MGDRSANTFWKLISQYNITIPRLQRDYAQGRKNNPAIVQIRNSLIDELYNHLTQDSSVLELNFVYGRTANGDFTPIDGQQRLTTLYLLHWYIFSRADYAEGLSRLEKFSYLTRDTSIRFCNYLCKTSIDFSKSSIEAQIKDCFWYTGSFGGDPTVQSMLVMLDTIHAKFGGCPDFVAAKDRLVSEDCNITFLWLQMEDFQKADDLYIKMNARGKLLSDFEIFKAKLQNSVILANILAPSSGEAEKMAYISKYNNAFAELFYQLFEDHYDTAMMDYVKAIFRDDYFCYVARCGVNQRYYRDDYSRINTMNGNVFFSYLEKGGINSDQCPDSASVIEGSIKKAAELLELFCQMESPLVFRTGGTKEYFDEVKLFKDLHFNKSMSDNVIRYALFSYIYKFGLPSNDQQILAYSFWKRFVYNVTSNVKFGGHIEYVCQAYALFQDVLNSIATATHEAILLCISQIDRTGVQDFLKHSIWEETEKAKLMLPANGQNSWYTGILKAEQHFLDGQIGFLLRFCADSNGTYSYASFDKYYDLSKALLTGDKRLSHAVSEELFEKSLLCMVDACTERHCHLTKQSNSSSSWKFLLGDMSGYLSNVTTQKKQCLFKALMDRLTTPENIATDIMNIIVSFDESGMDAGHAWIIPFVKNELFSVKMNYLTFSNCVSLNGNDILLLTTTTERGYSMEINTFLLYQELISLGLNHLELVLDTTYTMLDENGFPKRYIKYKGYKIGYMPSPTPRYVVKQAESVTEYTHEDLLEFIPTM